MAERRNNEGARGTARDRAFHAAHEISIASSQLQAHLEKEVLKTKPAAAGKTSKAAGLIQEVIKGDPLLHALQRCSRQLTKLRQSLLAQADGLHEVHHQSVVLAEEASKAQSTLLYAQQVAVDMYNDSLAQLNDSLDSESGHYAKVIDTIQSCDKATAVTAAALSSVISALSDFPLHLSNSTSGTSGRCNGDLGVDDSSSGTGAGRTEPQMKRPSSAPYPSRGGEQHQLGDAARSAATSVAAAAAAGGEGSIGRAENSSCGVNRSLRRNASARGCRSQAAATAGVWRPSRNSEGGWGTQRPPSAATSWGQDRTAATLTEMPMPMGLDPAKAMPIPIGLDPVNRAAIIAVAEDRKRRAASSHLALLGGRARGLGLDRGELEIEGPGEVRGLGGGKRTESASERLDVFVQGVAGEAVAALTAAAAAAAPLGRSTSGGSEGSAREEDLRNTTSTAAAAAAAFRRTSTTAGATEGATVRRHHSGHTPTTGNMFTPRTNPDQSARRGSTETAHGGARSTALEVRRQLVAGSGEGERRMMPPTLSNKKNGRGVGSAGIALQEDVHDRLAEAFLDDTIFYRSPVGSPRRSLSTSRATARRRNLLELHSAAEKGGGQPGRAGRWETCVSPSGELSRGDDRFLAASYGQSQNFGQLPGARDAGAAAATAATGGGGGGAFSPPQDIVDEDEATARRFAKLEQEAVAREDELLALRLAAREQAGAERRASRGRLHNRRSRRNASEGHVGVDSHHSAVAGQDGGVVSDAVRALQFQDIDENDFETLLELDEGGGEGGRCCAGGRGLAEDVIQAALQPGKAAGERLEESCAVCMEGFELDDNIAILPCLHAFHGGCIRKWLLLRNRCPTCLKAVVPDST